MITTYKIITATETEYSLEKGTILSHTRTRTVSLARNIAMCIARDLTDLSYPELGKEFQRHHTSVVSAVKRVDKLLLTDLQVARSVEHIISAVKPVGFFRRLFK